MRRKLMALCCFALVPLVVAGCVNRTTPGFPVAPKPSAEPVPAGDIGSLLSSRDQINEITGATMGYETVRDAPPFPAEMNNNPCAVLYGMNTASFNGEFTAYRQAWYAETQDAPVDHIIVQNAALFLTANRADTIFHDALKRADECDAVVARVKDDAEWKFSVTGPFDGDVVKWSHNKLVDGQLVAWRCSHEARVKNNVILETEVCQNGNGAPTATAIADQIAARVPRRETLPPPAPLLLQPGKVNSLFVPAPQLSEIVGHPLSYNETSLQPPSPVDLRDKSACAALLSLNTDSYGKDNDWTAFQQVASQDSESTYEHQVFEQAATYADADTAARLFRDAFRSVNGCNGAVVHNAANAPDIDWKLRVPDVAGDIAQWSNIVLEGGKPNTWSCAFDTRLTGNVILGAQVCQFGAPSDIVSQIADQMAGSLPK